MKQVRVRWLKKLLVTTMFNGPARRHPPACGLNRCFHSSCVLERRGEKEIRKKRKNASAREFEIERSEIGTGETTTVSLLPDIGSVESKMNKRLAWLNHEYESLKGGRVRADIFNSIMVQAYGSRTCLSNAAQAALIAHNKIHLSVYDPVLVQEVAKAIRSSSEGTINPEIQGNNLTVTIPKPSKEQRDGIIKLANKLSERVKQDIRSNRKEAMDYLKRIEKDIPKDDFHKLTKEIDTVTEKVIKKVTATFKDKEADILA